MKSIVLSLCLLLSGACYGSATNQPHVFRLNAAVAADSVEPIIAGLVGHVPSTIYIDSPGGSVSDGYDLVQAIEENGHVTCVVTGTAASMAAVILSSCQVRQARPRAVIMLHEPSLSTELEGPPNVWQSMADRLKALHRAMCFHLASHMKVSAAEIYARTVGAQQWWLSSADALTVGIVDAVVPG